MENPKKTTKDPEAGPLAGAAVASLALPLGLAACGAERRDASGHAPAGSTSPGETTRAGATHPKAPPEVASQGRPATAEAALSRLMEGNRRYAAGETTALDESPKWRREVAEEQDPFAVVLDCSDSRVPPELLFDQGLGDLFVVRVAGNVVNDAVLGSIEYAVGEFGVPLLMVLGHERCGAVTAAVEETEDVTAPPAHVIAVVDPILPAVEEARNRSGDTGDELVDGAVRANIGLSRERLRSPLPILGPAVDRGDLRVVGAYYDLEDGHVVLTEGGS